jgi:hypothetical protein
MKRPSIRFRADIDLRPWYCNVLLYIDTSQMTDRKQGFRRICEKARLSPIISRLSVSWIRIKVIGVCTYTSSPRGGACHRTFQPNLAGDRRRTGQLEFERRSIRQMNVEHTHIWNRCVHNVIRAPNGSSKTSWANKGAHLKRRQGQRYAAHWSLMSR